MLSQNALKTFQTELMPYQNCCLYNKRKKSAADVFKIIKFLANKVKSIKLYANVFGDLKK